MPIIRREVAIGRRMKGAETPPAPLTMAITRVLHDWRCAAARCGRAERSDDQTIAPHETAAAQPEPYLTVVEALPRIVRIGTGARSPPSVARKTSLATPAPVGFPHSEPSFLRPASRLSRFGGDTAGGCRPARLPQDRLRSRPAPPTSHQPS